MNSVTLTLPDPIYRQLASKARDEGVPFEQYLLTALSAHAMSGYRVRATTPEERAQQKWDFQSLLDRLGTASQEEIDRILDEREPAEMELELTPEIVAKFEEMIAEKKKVRKTG